jgi:hypothetical protein
MTHGLSSRKTRVTLEILSHWQPFQDLKLMFTGSLRAEQLSLRSQQRIVATVEDSVLRTEMSDLESQEEDAPRCILFFNPMSWFSTSMGTQILLIAEKPLATCGCRKFQLDPLGDHLNTCNNT